MSKWEVNQVNKNGKPINLIKRNVFGKIRLMVYIDTDFGGNWYVGTEIMNTKRGNLSEKRFVKSERSGLEFINNLLRDDEE